MAVPKTPPLPKVEVKSAGAGMAEIFIDGHKLPGVRDISLFMPLNEVPYVQIEIISTDITFEGTAELEMTVKDVVAEESYLSDITDRIMRALLPKIGRVR